MQGTCARPADELVDHPLLGLRAFAQIALDGVADQAPLRPGRDDAERMQLGLDVIRQADTDLRIILDLLPLTSSCGRPADSTNGFGCHGSIRMRRRMEAAYSNCCVCSTKNRTV